MSMKYIREYYNVPAKRGGKIAYTDSNGKRHICRIKSADGAHLHAASEPPGRLFILHPTWNVEYL